MPSDLTDNSLLDDDDAGAQDRHHEYDAPAPHDVPRSPSPSPLNDGRLDW